MHDARDPSVNVRSTEIFIRVVAPVGSGRDSGAVDLLVNRRQVLTGAAVAVGASALTVAPDRPAPARAADTAAPFLLGVASGDPLPDGVVLWTRLVRDRYAAWSGQIGRAHV